MSKIKAHMPNLYDDLKEILDDYSKDLLKDTDQALGKAADYLAEKYADNTPKLTGKTSQSWIVTKKYKNVKYINNTELTKNRIPVANLIEFSKNGKPFIRPTFEREKGNLIKIIQEELK